jgi:DNA mismatch repair ATPase MutS
MLAMAGWLLRGFGVTIVLIVLGVQIGFALFLRQKVQSVLAEIERRGRDLTFLASMLEFLEKGPLVADWFADRKAQLNLTTQSPALQVRRLTRLLNGLDLRSSVNLVPLPSLLLWSTHFAFAIERWRRNHGRLLDEWISTAGELEALVALAAYAYENPGDPFPTIVDKGALLEVEGLGHPLIPEKQSIRNDLRLGTDLRLLVVSGSNMSGKSTLLRSAGLNVVLALAGAPVRAHKLSLSPLAVGATLRILDSVQTGHSRFYAEITRIRQIVELTEGPTPVLFLLDEILHGTNSHDRRVGAEAVVRNLLDCGAIGLITTHDLTLAEIADALAPRAQNVHFEDQLVEGAIHFDYRMRRGVVQNSNALALMRSIGLKV